MTTRPAHRQPLQPLAPPSANIVNTSYADITTKGTNGTVSMGPHVREDMQDLGSVVSGLSSLEEDDADDFDKLMIQNARDERRLNEARQGRVQAFRKARIHPRVGLTIDNLERNNARNDAVAGAHVKFESPPSSNGSTRSDPAIHAPPGWGRKGRANRNWMRTITYEEEEEQEEQQQQQALGPVHDDADDARAADIPHRSVEDSPLSHKSSIHGTPRNDQSDWDLTFELNEASMIASTPYIPRNTALDDIRQREMESLKEQRVTSARLDRIREGSPEQMRRLRSSSAKPTDDANGTTTEEATQGAGSPQKRLRTRTNSWQSIGKSHAVTGIGKENSPVAVYKSAETISVVERHVVTAQSNPPKRMTHRREDSQDLLRRLARVSNTPSPGRVGASRPQTAPARQPNSSSQTMVTDTPPTPPERKEEGDDKAPTPEDIARAPGVQSQEREPEMSSQDLGEPPEPLPELEAEDVDATPMPVERSILNLKTPVVTGAWVDTPGPRTARQSVNVSRSPLRSPKKSSLRKSESPQKRPAPSAEEALEGVAAETIRPQLPSSALHALVQEAKTNSRHQPADYGDSTINSLEDLITPLPESAEGEMDEDTLQGLQLPTGAPRNEAERQRQQELLHLHRMNDRLRAARTSIRDASRGMKRVEDQVEHAETDVNGEQVKAVHRECPCTVNGGHQFSLWRWSKSFVWQERIKALREAHNTRWKMWGGLTGLGIFTIVFFTWWVSEEIACEIYCHPMYANSSPYPFSVNMEAPRYPFVIPTLIYRNFIRAWWLPLYSFLSWIGATTWKLVFGLDDERTHVVSQVVREGIRSTATKRWVATSQVAEEWDLRMTNDERIK